MGGEKKGMKALEVWCRQITNGYKDVHIANMTTAFRDGLAFCAVIHHFRPDLVDFESLSKENIFYNNNLAFSIAEQKLGIPALLDAEDMVQCKIPDRLSIMTYVSQLYNYFEGIPAKSPMKRVFKEHHAEQQILVGPPDKIFGGSKDVKSSMGLGRRQEQCGSCKNRVYILERLIIENKLYHRTCFKCLKCQTLLKPGSYVGGDEPNTYECVMCPHEERAGFDFSIKPCRTNDEQNFKTQTNVTESDLVDSSKADDLIIQPDSSKILKQLVKSENAKTEETINVSGESEDKLSDVTTENLNTQSSQFEEPSLDDESDKIYQKEASYEMEADSVLEALESSESSSTDSEEDESEACSSMGRSEQELEVVTDNSTTNAQNLDTFAAANTMQPISLISEDNASINDYTISSYSTSPLESGVMQKPEIPKKPDFLAAKKLSDSNCNCDKNGENIDIEIEKVQPDNVSNATGNVPNEIDEKNLPEILISEHAVRMEPCDETHGPSLEAETLPDDNVSENTENVCKFIEQEQSVAKGNEDHLEGKSNQEEDGDSKFDENDSEVKVVRSEEKDDAPKIDTGNLETRSNQLAEPSTDYAETKTSSNPFDSEEEDDVPLENISESYPKSNNPFGDSDHEANPADIEPETKISANPFGDSDDDNGKSNNKPDDGNPFADDDDEPCNIIEDNEWIQSVFGTSTLKPPTPPRPVPKPRTRTSKNTSMKPGSGTLSSRKKKRAPLPPGVTSTPEVSPKQSPQLRKPRPDPPPRTYRANSDRQKTPPTPQKSKSEHKSQDLMEEKNSSTETLNQSTPAKLTFGYWKRKKKAPPIPVTVRRQITNIPIKELQQELANIEEQHLELECAGVQIEKRIREMSEEEASQEEEDLIMQLFELVNKKNSMFRRQADLMYLKRQNRLEEEHTELEYQIRLLMQRPANLKTDFDKEKEEELLNRLLEVVELRNDIIESQERDRLRISAEEKGLEDEMSARKNSGNAINCIEKMEIRADVEEKPEVKPRKKKKKDKEKKEKKDKEKKDGKIKQKKMETKAKCDKDEKAKGGENKEEKKSKKTKKLIKLKLT